MLQPARVREDGRTGLAISDFFDFSVYVDAATGDIRRWYTDRFLRLRETSFRNPASYFARYGTSPRTRPSPIPADLGHHQRAEPGAERAAHPGRATLCPQGRRLPGALRAPAEALDPVTTARTVPVTTEMDGDELDAGDAWRVARRVAPPAASSFVRFRYGDGFSQPGARAPGGAGRRPVPARADRARRGHRLRAAVAVVARTIESVSPSKAAGRWPARWSAMRRARRRVEIALGFGLVFALVSMTTAMAQVERRHQPIYGIRRDARRRRSTAGRRC